MGSGYSILSNAGNALVDLFVREKRLNSNVSRPLSRQITVLELVCSYVDSGGHKESDSYLLGYVEPSDRAESYGTNGQLHIDDLAQGECSRINRKSELPVLAMLFRQLIAADPWLATEERVLDAPKTQIKSVGGREYDISFRLELREAYHEFLEEKRDADRAFWTAPISSWNQPGQY